MKILIALDASTHSEAALTFAARMRWPAGSRVLVTSVVPQSAGLFAAYEPAPVPPEVFEGERQKTRDIILQGERRLHESGLPTEARLAEGDPREALVALARTERVDLLIVGSHGRTGIARMMLGSVSSHVVTHAPCSVLVVKSSRPARVRKEE